MSDGDALLAAICADPDDDTPRLVYADWLDENGQPERAEFIRLQIERARLEPGDQRIANLDKQIDSLLYHRTTWGRPLWDLLPTAKIRFTRGFIERVEANAAGYLRTARALAEQFPIRDVVLRNVSNLCELNLHARDIRARLAAETPGQFGRLVNLLPQAPVQREPELDTGDWLILNWAVWSGPDREAVHALSRVLETQPVARSFRFAVRPFDDSTEFRTWCTLGSETASPVWVRLSDGRLVTYRVGLVPPYPLRDVWGG